MKRILLFVVFAAFAIMNVHSQTQGPDDCVQYNDIWGGGTWNPIWDFEDLKQEKITGLNIGGYYLFHGMLEYLPADYSDPTKKHPLIIFFHGGASAGNGTQDHLCRLFKDRGADFATHKSLPGRIEREDPSPFIQSVGAQTYSYIVASPQFSLYRRTYPPPAEGNLYPSAAHVEKVIDFMVARYGDKLDTNRIYLTGYSNGANMIMEYVGSSVERAKRIAAVMPISLCSDITHESNDGITGANIAAAGLNTWFVHCETDNPCLPSVPQEWISQIEATPGHVKPRYTLLQSNGGAPSGLYHCSDSLTHDAWSRAYDPLFTASFVNGEGSNDGINMNMYEWFVNQTNAVLPVTLKSFTARLTGSQVELKWVTTDEKDNASFTVERAGVDQRYMSLAVIPGAGNSSSEKVYTYADVSPLSGLGFYRLVQTDRDGKKTYYDIRRILNQQTGQSAVIVSPNPFAADVNAFINVSKAQKVVITLTDMTGKVLRTVGGSYAQGSTELKIASQDLPRGMYLLKVSGEDFNSVQKILKK